MKTFGKLFTQFSSFNIRHETIRKSRTPQHEDFHTRSHIYAILSVLSIITRQFAHLWRRLAVWKQTGTCPWRIVFSRRTTHFQLIQLCSGSAVECQFKGTIFESHSGTLLGAMNWSYVNCIIDFCFRCSFNFMDFRFIKFVRHHWVTMKDATNR